MASEHATHVDGLQVLLELQRDMRIVGKALNGYEAVELVPELRPHVVVIACSLPGLDGIEVAEQLRERSPASAAVILVVSAVRERIDRALRAGVKGLLPRDASGVELAAAVRAVAGGMGYLGGKVTPAFQGSSNTAPTPAPLELLTPRERRVLLLIVEGCSSAQIAAALSLSSKTVDTYRSRIRHKLGIASLPGLVKFAIREGLTPLY